MLKQMRKRVEKIVENENISMSQKLKLLKEVEEEHKAVIDKNTPQTDHWDHVVQQKKLQRQSIQNEDDN